MNHVEDYFKTHPNSNECFETSDKLLFQSKENAKAHGATLDDKVITPWQRTSNVKEPGVKQKNIKTKKVARM